MMIFAILIVINETKKTRPKCSVLAGFGGVTYSNDCFHLPSWFLRFDSMTRLRLACTVPRVSPEAHARPLIIEPNCVMVVAGDDEHMME